MRLFFKICCNGFHPLGLSRMERTAAVAVAAGNTVRSLFLQLLIMIRRHGIADHCQVVVFVDQPNIQTRRTGLAVIAVYADACRVFGVRALMTE